MEETPRRKPPEGSAGDDAIAMYLLAQLSDVERCLPDTRSADVIEVLRGIEARLLEELDARRVDIQRDGNGAVRPGVVRRRK